jgi:chemotaxis protein CheX
VNSAEVVKAMNIAVQITLKTMAQADVVMLDPLVKPHFESQGDVSGEMQLFQPFNGGMIALSFPKETIFHILSRIYRVDFVEIDRNVEDGVGELLNVIHGQFRTLTASYGSGALASPPKVVVGQDSTDAQARSVETLVVPFRLGSHHFHVYLQVA